MDSQAAKNIIIEKRFIAQWGGQTPHYFKNAPLPETMPPEYIDVLTFNGGGENRTIPNNKTWRFCSLIGQIRVPKGKGSKRAQELAESFQTIFENQTISDMYFRAATVSEVDGKDHYGINVLIPYEWERSNA